MLVRSGFSRPHSLPLKARARRVSRTAAHEARNLQGLFRLTGMSADDPVGDQLP
jgi:hypothetical protein